MGEILRIPSPAHPTVYYGCMMIELCKLQSTLHPALGAAINYLFEKIPYMQAECADRLADWLSFHLSNLDFKWLWSDWAKVVDLPPWALHLAQRFASIVIHDFHLATLQGFEKYTKHK